jgi:NAD(P)-dependent dehydrogenase (short-subunit alcohol dehydrogenase family)
LPLSVQLKPRVAVVTGASSGIGAALVRALAREQWQCVLLARGEERLRALAAAVGGEYEVCDVADRDAVVRAATAIGGRHARVDLLVANAGIPARTDFAEGDPERIEAAIRTNYLGAVWTVQAFLPLLPPRADVVVVVSVAGEVAGASGPYAAAKHAELAFSRSIAVELGRRGIRVHIVKPGFVETEGFPQGKLHPLLRRVVVGPDRVAAHILASLERGPRETTVPRFYRGAAIVQALAPNLLARALTRLGSSRIGA